MSLKGEGLVGICNQFPLSKVLNCLRQLVPGVSRRRPGFAPRSVHVAFAMDRLAMGQFFSSSSGSPLAISLHRGSIPIYHLGDENRPPSGRRLLQGFDRGRPQSHRWCSVGVIVTGHKGRGFKPGRSVGFLRSHVVRFYGM
jgi:hypothetical protein